MLTPAKIKNHHFDASGRNAYKAESVDAFFEEVAESYEQMFRENGEMYKKINLLAERLEEYRNDEDNIRNALLTAQRMADKITREANEAAQTMLSDASERAKAENEKTDAYINDIMAKAQTKANAVIEEANKQAEKIVYDATVGCREAAVSARDSMIKEEAALEMMKIEVTKFKQKIMDAYNAQLELIEQLPEVVYEKLSRAEESEQETPEKAVEETIEEPAEEDVEAVEAPAETQQDGGADELDVEHLQQMIDDSEDTDADEDPYVEDNEADAEPEEAPQAEEVEETATVAEADAEIAEEAELVLPEIEDDASTEELNKMVDDYSETSTADISFKKPVEDKKDDVGKDGFKVNFKNIGSFESAEEIDDDELDEFDAEDGEDGGFASKLKGFFRK